MLSRRLALFLFFLYAALLAQPCAATPFQWEYTGSLNVARFEHTATLLTNGEVLVAGGTTTGQEGLTSAELYVPHTRTWTVTGSLNTARDRHTETLLTNGEVLVAGGVGVFFGLASAELYDPGMGVVQGRGAVDNQGNEVSFNFNAEQASPQWIPGRLSFCDSIAGVCTSNGRIKNLSINGNTADFSGPARLQDGSMVTFSVSVTDNGWPGTSDTISISLSNGYSVSGNLTIGNIRIQ